MSTNPRQQEPEESRQVGGVLNRVNQFGAATEHFFSRIYNILGNKQAEYEEKLAQAERTKAQIQRALEIRSEEIERFQGILETLDEGIIMQDNEGRIVYINDAARDLLGNQKNFWDTELGMLFSNQEEIETLGSELTPLGEPNKVQVNNRIVGAQLAAVASSAGERIGTMMVLRDVTRDALTDRLKDQFVTAISHELKTPMTVIKGMSEVLLGSPDDQPPNRRLLETLSRNVDILDRMVIELLDVSEMGAGAFEIRQNKLELLPLLWHVVNGLEPDIKRNRLEVMVMTRDNKSLNLIGDDQRLRWALGHLIQNSVHYTEPNGKIYIQAGLDIQEPEHIRVDIMDTGVGISDKDMPHIFERFYRGDPRNQHGKLIDPRGLGQGLFVARTVAEAHGGYVSVESTLGAGTQFSLFLPAQLN